jgi:hypothetical protein
MVWVAYRLEQVPSVSMVLLEVGAIFLLIQPLVPVSYLMVLSLLLHSLATLLLGLDAFYVVG